MKSNQLTTILMALTAFSAVLSLIFCGLIMSFTRTIRSAQAVQTQAAEIQNRQIARQMLFNELGEYSKKNPDILRLLQPAGSSTPATTRPLNK